MLISPLGHFFRGERGSSDHWIWGWVGPRTFLDVWSNAALVSSLHCYV